MKERSSFWRTSEPASLASCSKVLHRSTKEQLRIRKLDQRRIRKLGLRSHKLVQHSNRSRIRYYTIFRTGQPMRLPK
jgi:hypothetical protein